MKNKLMLLVLALSLAWSGVVFGAPAEPEDVGFRLNNAVVGGNDGVATKVFILVRNGDRTADTSALNSGDVVVWDTNSDDGITVTTTTISHDGAVAGILVTALETADTGSITAADDTGRRNWGYAQVYGVVLANSGVGGVNNVIAGGLVITSGDAGSITAIEIDLSSDTTGVMTAYSAAAATIGFFMNDDDATASHRIFLRIL